jgi:hypothetical protein
MNEFYVGYFPKAPSSVLQRIRRVIVALFLAGAVVAIGFASVQKTFAPAVFEFGKIRTFEGVIELKPFPSLLMPASQSQGTGPSRYLLVATGKHGADEQIAAYADRNVRLRGTLIHRENQMMIELVSGSISPLAEVHQPKLATKDLGAFELIGEIVDSKCYLGVMNPGNGKVHRDCAARCLSGGIPPIFATNDFRGAPAILLLTGHDQKPIPKDVILDLVARPVRVQGKVSQIGEYLLLESEPSAISSLP